MQQQKTSLRWFARTALLLVLMMLTATTAWAFKTETATYTVTYSGGTITIKNGSTITASWTATSGVGIEKHWKANESHNLSNDMTIKPSADVNVLLGFPTTQKQTTFTFTTDGTTAITGVTFKNIESEVVASGTASEPVTSFSVTVPAATGFSTFVVTFGYISGSCGGSATWSLSKENGQYTALTIGGSGAMSDYNGSNTPWDNDLTRVTVGSSVTSIGNNAFNGCSNLTRVDVQKTDGLVTLGSGALTGCNALAAIVAPTPALAVGYQTAMNWSAHASKLRVALGNYLFAATDEGSTAAYAITNETDLRNLSAYVNADNNNDASGLTFRQTAHIALSNDYFTPIGNGANYCWFLGTYDGGGNTISGLRVYSNATYSGLFGYLQGTVKNVCLVGPNVASNGTYAYVGTIAGFTNIAHVENCWVYNPTVSATGTGGVAGAIIGRSSDGSDVLTNLYFYDSNGGHSYSAVKRNESGHVTRVGRARKVTLGSGITVSQAATNMDYGFVYNNERYYREGLELTLTATDELVAEAANQPTGYALTMMANGTATSSTTTYTVNSTDGDATLTAALRSDGQQHQVSYVDASGESHNAQAIPLDGSETSLAAGTYFVGLSKVNFYNTVTLGGDVTLILKDGCTMNVGSDGEGRINDRGIYGNYTLDIYGQPQGTGALNVYTTGSDNYAIKIKNLTIYGGNITANGTIGIITTGGVTINGGIVSASGSGSNNGIGISAYGWITINGGNVNATGSYGIKSTSSSVNLGWTDDTDCIYASNYSSGGGIIVQSGKKLIADDGTILTDMFPASDINGKTLRPCIALADYADNTNVLKEGKDKTIAVQLAYRTLYKDGYWNTLCLPFSLSEEQIAASPLNGATIKALDASASGLDNGTLTLAFTDVKRITAGQPYIIKWTTTDDNIVDPVFTGVTITSTTPEAVEFDIKGSTDKCKFVGQYNLFYITEEIINEIIMLSSGNRLGYSKNPHMLRPFRCHFEVPASSGEQKARSFVMDFGGEETGIETTDYTNYSDAWYTIDGRKLDSVPTKKGLYIHKGKKVVKK